MEVKAKLVVGDTLTGTLCLPQLCEDQKNALFFLRDISCVLTQSYLAELSGIYSRLQCLGVNLIVVVNASVEGVSMALRMHRYPFAVIADEGGLYEAYGVGCAVDKESLGNLRTMKRIQAAYDAGYVHGADTGALLRLPAWFLVDGEGTVLAVHYGIVGDDLPDMDLFLEQVKHT